MVNSLTRKNLIVIIGPTAIGKTSVGVNLADYFNTDIISADSRQFFKELDIGTAKPTYDEMKGIKHHFISNITLFEQFNAYQFEIEVIRLLDKLFRKHDIVLMVGGSGLYVDAVCYGIDDLPDADKEIRDSLIKKFKNEGIEFLQEKLRELDPEYYSEVDIENPKRIMRALEVSIMTGRPYSSFRKKTPKTRNFNVIKIGLNTNRELLFERINNRVEEMMNKGLLEEVKQLEKYKTYNALNTVGYKELFNYLDREYSLEEAVEKIKTNSRRYAKRQLTWFKKDKDVVWFDPMKFGEIIEFIEKAI